EIRLEITLSEEILTGTKHNKSIPSPFCNKGWLLLLTLKAIQFPNHELGLSPETLTVSVFEQKQAKKKGKSHKAIYPPKYQYEDPKTKKIKTWSGNAKMPKGLKMLLDEGKNLDDFLIQKTENVVQENV
ncbi:MAG TPA: H-NS family nucleoid-associated regulatory protein, partial [Arsenophonus nasoniae]|uniref:H-NS family nucleoid-associated regulatory protein n=2 Tax=Arsenophonus nasoniae TaxID=638 RepID=UPI0038795469